MPFPRLNFLFPTLLITFIALVIPALLILSLIIGLTAGPGPASASATVTPSTTSSAGLMTRTHRLACLGIPVLVLAGLIAGLNFNLSFIRPRLYRRAHGNMDGYRFVSGFPGVGSLLLLIAAALTFGSVWPAALGLVLYAIDTGGLAWLAVVVWRRGW